MLYEKEKKIFRLGWLLHGKGQTSLIKKTSKDIHRATTIEKGLITQKDSSKDKVNKANKQKPKEDKKSTVKK